MPTACRVCGEALQQSPAAEGLAYVCGSHLDEPEPPTGTRREVATERVRRLREIQGRLGATTIATGVRL